MDYLVDTSVLLRLFDVDDAENPAIGAAFRLLLSGGYSLVTCPRTSPSFGAFQPVPHRPEEDMVKRLRRQRRVAFIERWG